MIEGSENLKSITHLITRLRFLERSRQNDWLIFHSPGRQITRSPDGIHLVTFLLQRENNLDILPRFV
jgi:hypothetical protein